MIYYYKCVVCKKELATTSFNKRVCSVACKKMRLDRSMYDGQPLATASTGALSEMAVCCQLLKDGYSAFRSVSPAAFCDIVAIKDKKILLIEARTAYRDCEGKITFPKKIGNKHGCPTHYAIFLIKENTVQIRKITKKEKATYYKPDTLSQLDK